MKKLIFILTFVIIFYSGLCYSNQSFKVPERKNIVNIYNDCDDLNKRITQLNKDILYLTIVEMRQRDDLTSMEEQIDILHRKDKLFFEAMKISEKIDEIEKIKLLYLIIATIVVNVIFWFITIFLYIKYRRTG